MNTKFIGLDGFNEIESLSVTKKRANIKTCKKLNTAQKTVRFIKRASVYFIKFIKAKVLNIVAKKSDVKINLSNTKDYSKISSKTSTGAHSMLKSKAVLTALSCLVAVTLSCITVASALDFSVDDTKAQDISTSNEIKADDFLYESNSENGFNDFNNADSISTADEAIVELTSDAYTSITKALASENMQGSCFGLYIDGKLIGATSDVTALNAQLKKVLVDYRQGYDSKTTTEFANDVKVKSGNFSEDEIMSVKDIMESAQDLFSISLSTDIVYNREIKYETQAEYDDTKSSSYKKTKTEGKNGEEKVTLRTTFIDGQQTDAVETDCEVIKKAVDEVVIIGTKGSGSSSSSNLNSSSSGSFSWPMPFTHNITSYYGERWGRLHSGVDISDGGIYGQPISASDSGTVIFAGNDNSGYGNYVIIDHGNGYKTLYGHCSSLAVSAGQSVSKGDTVGYVGSTGNSTGPHLHFEVRYGDNRLDPMQFVS